MHVYNNHQQKQRDLFISIRIQTVVTTEIAFIRITILQSILGVGPLNMDKRVENQ
jgi:hypothetical protein